MSGAAGKWGAGALALAGAGAVLATLAVGGFWLRDRAMHKELVETRARADAALSAVITPETLAAADRSVYRAYTDQIQGTAFVIDRERGILATAAHVAEAFTDAEPNMKIVNRYGSGPLPVKAVRLHKGYRALDTFVSEYAPVDPSSKVAAPQLADILSNPLDVALLFVDPIDAKSGQNVLGPSLAIAPEESLQALKAGDVVAILGYPGDAMSNTIGEEAASSRVEKGVVGALISPIDHRAYAGDADTSYLIASRMELVGGNSGGPLINRAGEVVGISTQGRGRDGVAQRADLVLDVLDPVREATRYSDLYLPDWKRRLAAFPKAEEVLPAATYLRFRRGAEKDAQDPAPETIGEIDLKLGRPFANATRKVALAAVAPRFILRATDLEGAAAPAASAAVVDARTIRGFVFDKPGQYASTAMRLDPSKSHAVYAWDAGLLNGQGGCTLELFLRKTGGATFRAPAAGRLAAVLVPPQATGGGDIYEAVIRRPPCRNSNSRISFAVTTWDDGVTLPPRAPVVQTAHNGGPAPAFAASASALRTVSAQVKCGIRASADYKCGRPVHAVELQPGDLPR